MEKELELLFTSDTHGHIFPVDYAAGKPEEAGLLPMAARMKKGENTLILDGGDSLQGTPLTQYYIAHRNEYPFHPVAEAFNALGCDYFTLGNHDFNFGYEVLRDYLRAMKARCLCANVTDLKGELKLCSETVHELPNGLRVGITGIVTDYVMIWEQPDHLEHIRVTDAFEAARKEYEKLKNNCDITVCIYHGGFEKDLKTGQVLSDSRENVACRIAEELGYDILLTGHQHMMVEGAKLRGTYAVQPPANATYFMRLNLRYRDGEALTCAFASERAGSLCKEEPYRTLLPLEKDTQRWLDAPVGMLSEEIPPEEKLSAALEGSRVADLFNEVQLKETGADFSCTSLGNVPVGLSREVTMRNICGAYLFANTLVVLEVDREAIRAALERCASYFALENGKTVISEEFLKPKIEHYNYDFFAGLDYEFDLTRPVGQRVVKLLTMDGQPLTDRKYRLVTSNYRATGTGGYEVLGKCPVLYRGAREVPELIAEYIHSHSPLTIGKNSRLQVRKGGGD